MPRPFIVAPLALGSHVVRSGVRLAALGLLPILGGLARSASGQGAPLTRSAVHGPSAPISAVRYEVTVDSATVASRRLPVAMHFTVGGPGAVRLALPAWSPGHYVLLWFARRVSGFTPTAGGKALPWHQLDFQTWEVDGTRRGAQVTVKFDYLADTIDRAVAWTRPDFAFFNGTNVFMYPVGRGFDWPAEVIVHTAPAWRIATGMPERTAGGAAGDTGERGGRVFFAGNYHDLVDCPFFVGRFDLDSAAVGMPGGARDHWVRAATYPSGSVTGERMSRLLDWLTKLAPVEAAVFHVMPWRSYTVLQIADTAPNGGGLEHHDSQLDEVQTDQLDAPWLPWLYSHEMFHSWNVKRLRPADLVPYRYDDAQPTGWLWVSEGITDYYADLSTRRGGIAGDSAFFASMAYQMVNAAAAPPTALSDASLRAWVGATDGSAGLYYPKGALAGFMLDILVRDASDNAHSLDDVMRALYGSTYGHGRGFSADEWWGALDRAARPGRPRIAFAEVRRRYIDGRDPYPWETVLPLAGLRLRVDTVEQVRLGVGTAPDSDGVRITFVAPGSAAAAAGITRGDVILTIGDISARSDGAIDQVRAKYGSAGGTVPVTLRRASERLTVQMAIRVAPDVRPHVEPLPDASPKATRIRQGLLTGTTG